MKNNIATLGAIWGDEGKGKITDLLAALAALVVRYNGGGNAGHTLSVDGKKYVTHMLPSGVLHKEVKLALAQGMVIDPVELVKEIKSFEGQGISFKDRLYIDSAVHIILPKHIAEDSAREDAAGGKKFGTTKRGISPCYAEKHRYTGLRLVDIYLGRGPADLPAEVRDAINALFFYNANVSLLVNEYLDADQRVVFEGAQATLLDIDHGQYPFVSSSSAVAGGICTGVGLSPHKIGELVGVVKAYATKMERHSPVCTEIEEKLGEHIRQVGGEYGATTGRPRRIAWLDLPLLAYAHQVNGFTSLALTKIDCLRGISPLQICIGYKDKSTGEQYDQVMDADVLYGNEALEPVYEQFDGFDEDISGARTFEELPAAVQKYVQLIEMAIGVPVDIIGVGPNRDQIIVRKDLWK